MYSILHLEKPGNKLMSTNTTERVRDIQCILRPLKEVWLKVGLEKLESHEGVAVKVLLDSGVTGLFMDITFVKEKRFKMEKLKKPLLVRNVDGTVNARMQLGKNSVNTGNAVASSPQPRNRLGKGRGKDDALSTYIWKKKARRKGEKSEEDRKEQGRGSIKRTGA